MIANRIVAVLLEGRDFPASEIERMAARWFKLNAGKLADEYWELALTFYLDPGGKLCVTPLNRGDEAEVDFPDPPAGCDPVGSLHTHVGCEGEFSDYDTEQGQKYAAELQHPYYMFVVGPGEDGGMVMNQELFEP